MCVTGIHFVYFYDFLFYFGTCRRVWIFYFHFICWFCEPVRTHTKRGVIPLLMLTKRSTKTYNHYDELRGSGLKVASHFLCYRNFFSILYVYYGSLVAVQTSHSKTFYWQGRVFLKYCPLLCICSAISIWYCTIYFLEITDLKTRTFLKKIIYNFVKRF